MVPAPPRTFVTGAGGRTGRLVIEKLQQHGVPVVGLVRRPEQQGIDDGVVLGNILKPETYEGTLSGCDKLVILTSAVPKMKPRDNPSDPPEWYFEPGGDPETVDWQGQRVQIDLAKKHGLQQVVLVSSMGVTRADHPLNRMGNILTWKRTAEEYLVASGVAYTIIHPGGLTDAPGGKRELLVGKRDEYMETPFRTVPRADVAEVVCQALLLDEALNKSFDLVSRPEGEGEPTTMFNVLFDQTTAGL